MPRGEETQEPTQESQEGEGTSREVKAQDEVKEQETKRDQEVVEAPQAVVERERPVAESEAIEAAVVEAIEAVPEDGGRGTGEDGGQETEDRKEAAEAAADGGRETEDRGPGTGEDTEQKLPEEEVQNQPGSGGGEVAATPINLPNVAEEPDHGPDPIEQTSQTDAAVRTSGQEPGDDVAATPD